MPIPIESIEDPGHPECQNCSAKLARIEVAKKDLQSRKITLPEKYEVVVTCDSRMIMPKGNMRMTIELQENDQSFYMGLPKQEICPWLQNTN